ncbi:MAG TPA: ATP-binding cassette domain-containing protein [Burkholderiaceae bacterium]|nr:ATP-binding cassette domain-containing protein [Burkholderiaceae bacterium]
MMKAIAANVLSSFRTMINGEAKIAPPTSEASHEATASTNATQGEHQVIAHAISGSMPTLKRALAVSVVVNIVALLPAVFMLQIYDRVIYRSGLSTLAALVIGMALTLAIDLLLRRRRASMLRDAAVQIDAKISHGLISHVLALPLRTLESRPTATWFLAFKDVESVRAAYSGALALTLLDVPFALFAIALIGFIALPVLPVVLVSIGALLALAWFSSNEARSGRIEEYERARTRDNTVGEICRARASIKALSHDESVKRSWRTAYVHWMQESSSRNGEMEEYRELSLTLSMMTSMLITVAGALAVINQWMTVGALIAANMLAAKAVGPLVSLCNQWRAIGHARQARARLEATFKEPREKADVGLRLPAPRGCVRIENVSFRYADAPAPVLQHVSGVINPGLCAVVGDNGGGKSTLLKMLAGLYTPDDGRICIDEYDIAQFSRAEIQRWVGYLPQATHIFEGTILENLRYSAPDADDDAIVLACQRAGAHGFISQLPDGYGTQVGEGGARLSAGQRRRIAIAQALLHDPRVLLLDEPTNDLDFSAESHLLVTLKQLSAERTIIVITHSIRLMAACERLLHVSKGGLQLGGTAEMLHKLYGIGPAPVARAATQTEPRAALAT